MLPPIWTYGLPLWGTASNSKTEMLQRLQNKVTLVLVNAWRYVPNGLTHSDLNVSTVREVYTTVVDYKLTPTTWRVYYVKTKRKTEDWKDLNQLIWQPGSLRPPSYFVITLSSLSICVVQSTYFSRVFRVYSEYSLEYFSPCLWLCSITRHFHTKYLLPSFG